MTIRPGMNLVPKDLVLQVASAFKIKRGWGDSLGAHIIRCLDKVQSLDLEVDLQESLISALAIHEEFNLAQSELAWLIDVADTNVSFTQGLVRWLVSDRYQFRDLPPKLELIKPFNDFDLLSPNVKTLLGRKLLTEMLTTVIDWWGRVPASRVPEFIAVRILSIQPDQA